MCSSPPFQVQFDSKKLRSRLFSPSGWTKNNSWALPASSRSLTPSDRYVWFDPRWVWISRVNLPCSTRHSDPLRSKKAVSILPSSPSKYIDSIRFWRLLYWTWRRSTASWWQRRSSCWLCRSASCTHSMTSLSILSCPNRCPKNFSNTSSRVYGSEQSKRNPMQAFCDWSRFARAVTLKCQVRRKNPPPQRILSRW